MSEAKNKTVLWKKALGLVIVLVLLADTLLLWQMSSVVMRVDKYNQGVIDEVGGVVGDVNSFGEDLNEIRRFLLLPERNYSGSNTDSNDDSTPDENTSPDELGLYAFLENYSKDQKTAEHQAAGLKAFNDLANNADFKAKLAELQFAWQKVDGQEMQAKLIDKMPKITEAMANATFEMPIFSIFFNPEENLFHVQSALEDKTFAAYTDANFVATINQYLTDKQNEARVKKAQQKDMEQINAQKSAEAAKASQEAMQKDFIQMLHDPAFVKTLADQGLQLVEQSRTENNKLIFDVINKVDAKKFSFALELSTGMIKVLRDGQELSAREFLNTDEGSKKKP